MAVLLSPEKRSGKMIDAFLYNMEQQRGVVRSVGRAVKSSIGFSAMEIAETARLEEQRLELETLISYFTASLPVKMRRVTGNTLWGLLNSFASASVDEHPVSLPASGVLLDGYLGEDTIDVERDHLLFEGSITPAAFNTAVGLVMQHVQSGIGWIAAANTTSHMSTSSSSSLFTASVTHKETANTAPVWTTVLPEGAAPGQQEGYLLPVPGSSASTPQAAVASLNVSQDAQTIGGLTNATAQFPNNTYLGQLEVNGGYVYVPAGAGASLPTAAFQSFFHSTATSGFTGLFFDLVLSVIGGASGFLGGIIYNVAHTGGAGFTNIQYNLVGGNCGSGNRNCLTGAPVAMSASYNSAQAYGGYYEGYSNSDTNPTSTNNNQWDYLPQTASEVEQSPQNVQGGFGQGYQQTTITPGQAQKGETLSDMANQTQKTGSGYINFGSNTGGITGPSMIP
jgi:hypothetical protein